MSASKSGNLLLVAMRYLKHRRFATIVSILAIALSLTFVVGIGLVNFAVKKTAVEGAIRYPLVIGSERSSAVQMIMSTIFHVDQPVGKIKYEAYEEVSEDRRVIAAYPIGVADSLQNYPIIGTIEEFPRDFGVGCSAGRIDFSELKHAVLGSEVAQRVELEIGDQFTGVHGMVAAADLEDHSELVYEVVGILNPTGGPEDAAIYTNIKSVWFIHDGERTEARAEYEAALARGEDVEPPDDEDNFDVFTGDVTAVFVKTKNPVYTSQLEAEWSLKSGYQGVDTGKTVRRLVQYMNKGEQLVELFSALTLIVAVVMILVTLVMSINERRKELALMRSLGVGRLTISLIVMIEAFAITLLGALVGVVVGHGAVWWFENLLVSGMGISVEPWVMTRLETWGIAITLVAGQLLALAAMVFTYRMNLVEEIAKD
ncbi:MAG: FtsX-like permease family protein [Polyangia bacterium]